MKKIKEDSKIEELLTTLFLEVPSSVTLGAMDAANDLVRRMKVPEGHVIFLNNIGIVEEMEGLAKNPRPIRLPKRRFDIKSRHRVRDMLLASVIDMDAKEALRFLGKLIRAWLMNASKDYLVCDQAESEWKVYDLNANRVSVVRECYNDIARSYELNY